MDAFKYLDGRRMTNVCDRWAKNHTDDLQGTFFNAVGFESWENVRLFLHGGGCMAGV